MRKHFSALALLLSATAVQAAPLFTFNLTANGSTGEIASQPLILTYFSSSSERQNETSVYRDEVWDYGSTRFVTHYADVSYQQHGSYYDSYTFGFNNDTATEASKYVLLTGSVSYDQARANGTASLDMSANISGTYTRTPPNPRFPGVRQGPAVPTFAAAQSIDPAELVDLNSRAWFNQDNTFYTDTDSTFTIGSGGSELALLLYSTPGLNSEFYSLSLTSHGYDTGLHQFTEVQYLGYEILPVPEPSAWAMLLAGAGVLALSRRRRAAGKAS
ncbi:MAG TPA: PEP-CTERM sorting domain-containing protein [Pseudoduganella sp.]|jgi:hypothetical protein